MTALKRRSGKKEKALATKLYAHRDRSDDWDETPTEAQVHAQRAIVTSLRLPIEEFRAVQNAAKSAGQTVSEFIRTAIASRLHGARMTAMYIAAGSSEGRSQATVLASTLEGGHTHNPGPEIPWLYANLTGSTS